MESRRFRLRFYYSASTRHFFPGALILRSFDLFNWEYTRPSAPSLDFGDEKDSLNLNGPLAYILGIRASTLRYRLSNNRYYWIGCIDSSRTSTQLMSLTENRPKVRLVKAATMTGMLVDEDTLHVVYGGGTDISIAQPSDDGLGEMSNQEVYTRYY
ncbi:hypothetical protein VKT23_018663 [Stygiomarasmius scandens]|uniref:Glycosyl hydrolase family 32 N-terminal domain-containing protein n=1 Tax=Marasmiellus scandens TaxID=2682957 RepID=A0ABR1IRS4_9AGAR